MGRRNGKKLLYECYHEEKERQKVSIERNKTYKQKKK